MTRKTTTRRSATRKPAPRTAVTSRSVLLAGLGAVSLGRKQARESIGDLVAGAGALPLRGSELAHAAGQQVAAIARQAQARVAPLKKQAAAFATTAENQFLVTVAPVLEKLGVIATPKRRAPARKGAARPATRKRSRGG